MAGYIRKTKLEHTELGPGDIEDLLDGLRDEEKDSALYDCLEQLTMKELRQVQDFMSTMQRRLDSNPEEAMEMLADLHSEDMMNQKLSPNSKNALRMLFDWSLDDEMRQQYNIDSMDELIRQYNVEAMDERNQRSDLESMNEWNQQSDFDSMDDEQPVSEMMWRIWTWINRDEDMGIVKTRGTQSVCELLEGAEEELGDLCNYFGVEVSGTASRDVRALRDHLEEYPRDLAYVFSPEEIHALLEFFAKPIGVCNEVPDDDTMRKAIMLGMFDVGEEKVNRRKYFAIKPAKDASELLEALSEREWKSARVQSEKVLMNCLHLVWMYPVMEEPSFCAKYREYFDSSASDDVILRCVYLSGSFRGGFNLASSEDGDSYIGDIAVGMDDVLDVWLEEDLWEMEYRPLSQEERENAESGYADRYPDWEQLVNYLYVIKSGEGIDTDEWHQNMYYDVINDVSIGDLWDYFLDDDEDPGIDEYGTLWKYITGVYMNTGLPKYKGYSRVEYAQKKGFPLLDYFRDADDLEYVSEISRRTHLYEMLPEFQLRLFEIMNNEDFSRQKRELQAILRELEDGNSEIEFLLHMCLGHLGEYREERTCLKRLVKEQPDNSRLAELLKDVKWRIQEQDMLEQELRESEDWEQEIWGQGIPKQEVREQREKQQKDEQQDEPSFWDMMEDMERGKFPKSDTTTYRRIQPKVGRNDPCPCGSGKKYKKCCGR